VSPPAVRCAGQVSGHDDFLIPIAKGMSRIEPARFATWAFKSMAVTATSRISHGAAAARLSHHPIYEGTNGIQAMDLLGRKLGQNKGQPMMDLLAEIQATLAAAKAVPRTAPFAEKVESMLNKLGEVAMHMAPMPCPTRFSRPLPSPPVPRGLRDMVMAWMLLWRARIAAERLAAGAKEKDALFYEGQIKSVEFFTHTILPVTFGKMKAILDANSAIVDIPEDAFGGNRSA